MAIIDRDIDGLEAVPESLEIPEYLRPREYGRKIIEPIRLGNLIRLSQTRDGINPEIALLKESIDSRDLINQIDVGRMDHDSLASYIDFVNRLWGSTHDIGDFLPDIEGFYYLVIAGHSRTEAMEQLEIQRSAEAAAQGHMTYPYDATIFCKVHDAPSPFEIISLQLDENIYKQPSAERKAMAIVETYLYGLETGKWSTKAGFMEFVGDKFTEYALDQAIHFAELPAALRDLVFLGSVKYGAAVELSKALPVYRQYVLHKYFGVTDESELTDTDLQEFEEDSMRWATVEMGKLQTKKLNVTAAKRMYEFSRRNWEQSLADGSDPDESQLFDVKVMMFNNQRREWRNKREQLKAEHLRLITEMAEDPLSRAAQAVDLHSRIYNDDEALGDLSERLTRRLIDFVRRTGAVTNRVVELAS